MFEGLAATVIPDRARLSAVDDLAAVTASGLDLVKVDGWRLTRLHGESRNLNSTKPEEWRRSTTISQGKRKYRNFI